MTCDQLNELFLAELRRTSQSLYEPLLSQHILTPREADAEVLCFYQQHRPALQEVYGTLTHHWSAYYQLERTRDGSFLPAVEHFVAAMRQHYDVAELGVDYYLQQLRHPPQGTPFRHIRQMFMDRWFRVLSDREYSRQGQYIHQLCQQYQRQLQDRIHDAVANTGQKGDGMAARMNWLMPRQDPFMRQQLQRIRQVMLRNPIARQLLQLLGRQRHPDSRLYRAVASHHMAHTMQHATHSDIVGICEGRHLSSLLPSQYAMMADSQLEPLFLSRLADGHLQMFDSLTLLPDHARATPDRGRDISNPMGEGPFVVCVDSSGSMAGNRELVAKALVLTIAMAAERVQRRCVVVMFSDQISVCEFHDLAQGVDRMQEFLCGTFHGGTSPEEAISHALTCLEGEDFAQADLLLLSDFEMPSPPLSLHRRLLDLKSRGTRCYTVAFGDSPNDYYTDIADRAFRYS